MTDTGLFYDIAQAMGSEGYPALWFLTGQRRVETRIKIHMEFNTVAIKNQVYSRLTQTRIILMKKYASLKAKSQLQDIVLLLLAKDRRGLLLELCPDIGSWMRKLILQEGLRHFSSKKKI